MLGSTGYTAAQTNTRCRRTPADSLVRYLDPCHPLLRKLREETPGSYHHSLVVGSLAEAAAFRVGADPRLARVGALYHDVGKTKWPALFGENGLPSPHGGLDPIISAQYIIDHVTEGEVLAEAYGLPESIKDLIAQHHGTSLVGYFYHKAVMDGQPVSDAAFRYPGPRPQTPEAGILLLADCVEAAVRSSKPAGQKEIAIHVARLTEQRWTEGELAESGLVRADLGEIRTAFCKSLQGVYHTRVTFPAPAFQPRMTADSTRLQSTEGATKRVKERDRKSSRGLSHAVI